MFQQGSVAMRRARNLAVSFLLGVLTLAAGISLVVWQAPAVSADILTGD